MYKYQYKELDHVNCIIISGFTSKHIASELRLLAKYYNEEGYSDEKVKEELHRFCGENLKGYNAAIHYKIINDATRYGVNEKNKLIQIDQVEILQKELDVIAKMDITHEYKRVVFTLMVLSKLSKMFLLIRDGEIQNNEYYFGGHKNYRELVSLSKITFNKTKKSKVKNIHDLIHILDEKKIVEIRNNGKIKLNFMYEIDESDGGDGVAFIVDNYNEIGFFYDLQYGENRVKRCEECRVPIRANANTVKYCRSCSLEIKRNQNRTADIKYKQKMKSEKNEKG